MIKEILYTYLGTNGTVTTPIHLENIYYIRKIRLLADYQKVLTKDNQHYFKEVTVSEEDVNEWIEINDPSWVD